MDFKTVAIIGGSARNKGALLMLDSTLKLLIQKKIKKVRSKFKKISFF